VSEPIRINLWSGPRNISTALMRAFENRADCAVIDEPFYGAYLAATRIDHPLREAVLAAWPTSWDDATERLMRPAPGGAAILYAKQMCHHVPKGADLAWMARCRNAFLIRAPEEVLASYARRRAEVSLADIGCERQVELFDREAQRLGRAPPVIEARDVLADPRSALEMLCRALTIPFDPAMLAWPAGPRASDGPWASAWYGEVWRSTAFAALGRKVTVTDLDARLLPIAKAARPFYDRLARHRLSP
jgi:hypothetical protein